MLRISLNYDQLMARLHLVFVRNYLGKYGYQVTNGSEETVIAVLTTLYIKDALDLFEIAISSLENQNGYEQKTNIYLCCDGPLTPEQDEWLENNKSRFYKIIVNEQNSGLAISLNKLMDAIEDETYVFRMDGDDISHPDRFKTQIQYLEDNPEIGLVGCQAQDIDEQGNFTKFRNYPTDDSDCLSALKFANPVLHPTYCMRNIVVKDKNNRYPNAYLSEDLAFLIQLSQNKIRFANCEEVLLSWRVGDNFLKRRRSFKRGYTELLLYMKAVRLQDGLVSLSYMFPILRFLLRLMPHSITKTLYSLDLRERLLLRSKVSKSS